MTDKKYEFTEDTKMFYGRTLHRIKALRSFGDVSVGDLGGWIEKEDNLSQVGNAWVSDNAEVFDNAAVSGNALVTDNACVSGKARVTGNSGVYGNAWVNDNADVFGNADVSEKATKPVINLSGLRYNCTITDEHLRLGCQCHTFAEWDAFDDSTIADMDVGALEFWKNYKDIIIQLCVHSGRYTRSV